MVVLDSSSYVPKMGGISYHGRMSVAAVPVDRVDAPFLVSQTDLRSQFSCLFRRKACENTQNWCTTVLYTMRFSLWWYIIKYMDIS